MNQKIVVILDAARRARMEGVAKMSGLNLTSWVRSELIKASEASAYFVAVDRALKAKELNDEYGRGDGI